MLLISGFLGSGKTTFIIKLIKHLSDKNTKTALIVNEAGEIGVDNQYMKQLGYDVWELFGGCICCSMSSNLKATISELSTTYNPEIIIIEPSGVAEPDLVYESLLEAGISKENIYNFLILDPTRIKMFIEILTPLLDSSLNLSDAVIMNKIDVAHDSEIKECENIISKMNLLFFKENFKDDLSDKLVEHMNSMIEGEVM